MNKTMVEQDNNRFKTPLHMGCFRFPRSNKQESNFCLLTFLSNHTMQNNVISVFQPAAKQLLRGRLENIEE